jgi:pSer/pThr/pTyr-binding forkhead associated (FHA) protein
MRIGSTGSEGGTAGPPMLVMPPPAPAGAPTPIPRTKTPLAGLTVPAPGSGVPASATAAGRTVVAPPMQALVRPPGGGSRPAIGSQDLPFSPFDAPSGPMRDEMPAIQSREFIDEDLTERHHQSQLRVASASDTDRTVPHSSASLPAAPVSDSDKTVPHPSVAARRKTLADFAAASAPAPGSDKTRPDVPGGFSGGPSGQTAHPQVNTPRPGPGNGDGGPRLESIPPSGRPTSPGHAPQPRLVIVSRDGTEGEAFPFAGTMMTIGRTHGDLLFPEDPFLSPVHVRLQMTDHGKILLVDAGTTNGVYLRIEGTSPVYPGDHFMVGHQLLRLENLDGQVQETPAGFDGTRMFGTPLQPAWGRLTQVGRGGMAGDKFYLRGARVVIGREDGDLTFPNDPFVSREHASLRLEIHGAAMAVYLEDFDSANGTYVRIRGSAELGSMDTFRVGDQILRLRLD